MFDLHFTDAGIAVGDRGVDVRSAHAVAGLRDLLGPEIHQRPVGVRGSGRTGHWLTSGVFLMSQLDESELVEVIVCFDPAVPRFPEPPADFPSFLGRVLVADGAFSGGDAERAILALPELEGFGGARSVKAGTLHVGFALLKQMGRFGKRTGSRRLARIDVSWDDPKPFPGPRHTGLMFEGNGSGQR